jgi:hypothetical protein
MCVLRSEPTAMYATAVMARDTVFRDYDKAGAETGVIAGHQR